MSGRADDEKEMSMEEILTSIRKYVIEEKKNGKTPSPADSGPPPLHPINETYDDDEIIELDNPIDTPPKPPSDRGKKEIKSAPMSMSAAPIPQSKPLSQTVIHPTSFQRPETPLDEPLLSAQTLSSATQALARLLETSRAPSPHPLTSNTTVSQLITDTTRPLIKEWLDQNLAPLVESMVAREIERLTGEIRKP